jgi:hypothetical protein
LLLSACGGGDDADDTARREETTTTTSGRGTTSTLADQGAASDRDAVLLDAGAEPRRRLRLRPTLGAEQLVTMRLDQYFEIAFAGFDQEVDTPPFEIDLQVRVVRVEDARITTSSEIVDVRVDAGPADDAAAVGELRATLAASVGVTSRETTNDRGLIISSAVEGFEDFPGPGGEIARSISDQGLSAPFPIEAVGVGARWRVMSTIPLLGVEVTTTSTYEVVEIRDDGVSLRTDVEVAYPDEPVELAPGARFDFGGAIVRGSGTAERPFDAISGSSEIVSEGSLDVSIDAADEGSFNGTYLIRQASSVRTE